MSYTKGQLIDQIIRILQTEFQGRDAEVTARDREFLHNSTDSWLENKLRQLEADVAAKGRQQQVMSNPAVIAAIEEREQGQIKLGLVHIYRTLIGNRVAKMCEANDNLILGWLHPGEFPSVEWFKKVLVEQPSLAKSLIWQSADMFDPAKRKKAEARELEQDKETFAEAARKYQVSENTANFNLVRQTLGEGFGVCQVQQVAGLSPASLEEIDKWQAEAAEQHQDYLINQASPDQLRVAVRSEAEIRQKTQQQEQAARELEAAKQRDQYRGYKTLPPEIDSKAIKQASADVLKRWMSLYGSYQITVVLQGRS